ncbi:Lipolytic protein G-D-S-L family [uncultured Paludibacter sp.]|uniref:Lipolytic protein G-D-S-L family n=1 Tax=uncultured Paludibacter sp. TaxID=497635 RepID=A0A653ACP6_9BACT|nr:Lipolytic protein G-D-S-L family [uncultured Paludibacter sp.]
MLMISFGGSLEAEAQDWANLQRYQHENDSVMLLTAPKDRVVFMGNSITQGWKETHPEFFSQNPYLDRGISGQTTPQMLVRFRQDVISLKPKVVVILAGTNDIAGNTGPSTLEMIMDNIASMAELAKSNGIQPVLCSVLPAYDYSWKKGMEPNIKIPKLNEMIKTYAKKMKFTYVDYFTPMAEPNNAMKADLTYDGVHCTSKGYFIMESIIVPAIQKALKKKK